MNRTMKNTVAVAAGSALLVAGAAGTLAQAQAVQKADVTTSAAAVAADAQAAAASSQVSLDKVEGSFSFTQAEVADNAYLARNFKEGSKYLCGAKVETEEGADESVENWVITVDGAVDKGYSSTVEQMAESPEVQAVLMGCSCLGNPTDGTSAANALVRGISALIMVQMAEPAEGANTVVFTSSDGYQVALPLSYLETHYCPVVFDVNGARIADSMGGANQLWLGATPASYFIRNVSSITVEARDAEDVPASPTSDEARAEYGANLPNVGILLGGEVA